MKQSQWIDVLNRGLMWNFQGQFRKGFPLIQEAYTHIPEIAGLAYAEALCRFEDYKRGFALYEKYRPSKKWFKIEMPEWQGEIGHLFCASEGGYGDTILGVRYIPVLERMGMRVSLGAWSSFKTLFRHQEWCHDHYEDKPQYWISLMSLPGKLNQVLSMPYIRANPVIKSHGEKPTIGYQWKAGALLDGNDLRSLPVELCLDERFHWVSLGLDNSGIRDWNDTASFLSGCDLVLTVDTAIAHLAGAMGKPVWLLLGDWSDWKWGVDSDTTDWYPSMRIFRGNGYGWEHTLKQVQLALDSVATNAVQGVP